MEIENIKSDERSMEQTILGAAETLFIEQGFDKTSTGQIAKLAGCNQALVHYYYRTKEKLFDLVFEKKMRMALNNFLQVESEGLDFEKRIPLMVGLHFDFLKNNPRIASFLLHELSRNPARIRNMIDKIRQYAQPLLERLNRDLEEAVKQGRIRPITGIDLLLTIVSLNVAPFLIRPVFQTALSLSDKEIEDILENRKREIVETILSRLRPVAGN